VTQEERDEGRHPRMLELGAVFMRTEVRASAEKRRVVSARLLEGGFEFQYPRWREAARDLYQRWRQIGQSHRPSHQKPAGQISDVRSA
jgi:Domain of unknown function (DUF1731)